jgi:2-C-methyl-D-erythritol 4-phosphate cytidylyltransferase/2-C-methyl-D-erythritol 2,4-cyclodiphosphate synthase
VLAAFQAVGDSTDIVIVHDAARPFASADLVSRTIAAAAESGAALAALPATDTVKRSGAPSDAGAADRLVAETLPREEIYLAQTPQAFRRDVLGRALALAESASEATDEAMLAEKSGARVRLVEGETTNIKITTRSDLAIAEAIARGDRAAARGAAEPETRMRVGTGYDLHRLVEGRPLILGGVAIPFDRGLAGHSDADAVCHAVTDAVLGAAGAGDIGRHFPDADPAWRDANSLELLRRAMAIVRDRGYEVANVDVVVIAERPRLAGHVDAMRASVAAALGVAPDNVSVKGKTNEGVGELGAGLAIAVHAVALLHAR